ncbi:HMA2 domain-containing protein [Bacillus taeanensis]|uniref:Metal ABC transporter ATPase n=1 Tax=Bacillus taeanensis TaxID=273032 RepID=A0A366XXT8_9BACI|nr:metal ABC transporter ATPase [Bacillus taeanensis]RBW68761.1 metal ABC transporter ATPase [Bacillus taeanensis]
MTLLKNAKLAIYARKIGKKYQITLKHWMPGRIRLTSPLWKNNSSLMTHIITRLNAHTEIYHTAFTKETGSLLIEYKASVHHDENELIEWITLLEVLHEQYI